MDVTQLTPDAVRAPTGFDRARAVADAVLYEGYLLYPYRRSSPKNRVRWQFGVLAPRAWIEGQGPVRDSVAGSAESWFQQTECLLEAPESAVVHLRLRFLQPQARSVQVEQPDGGFRDVDALELDGTTHLSFDEAVPREYDVVTTVRELLDGERTVTLQAPGGEDVEALTDPGGAGGSDDRVAGRVVRRRFAVSVAVRLSARLVPAPFRLLALRVRTENTVDSLPPDRPREEALRHSAVATHSFLALSGGSFLSLLEPPAWAAPAAAECTNLRTFPVLAGEPDGGDIVLSSPIILYDHPQVAPESPGDLFDASEIDEILSLRTLTLTDEEKREARATDPRAAAIVDRVDAMPPEMLERLHGAVRSMRRAPSSDVESGDRPETPWWDPGADASVSPETDVVVVDGVRVGKGCRVRLRPRRRGTDAHDMFLAGRTAHVEAVLLDVDGSRHIAVTIDDDPGAELHQWYGRFHYYAPEEVEPLGDRDGGRDEEAAR